MRGQPITYECPTRVISSNRIHRGVGLEIELSGSGGTTVAADAILRDVGPDDPVEAVIDSGSSVTRCDYNSSTEYEAEKQKAG